MRILSESTPQLVRSVLALAGLAVLALMSLLYYAFGYSIGMNGLSWDRSHLFAQVSGLAVLVLLGALGPAMIATNLRRPRKDFWLWAAVPLSMLLIGYATEVDHYGF